MTKAKKGALLISAIALIAVIVVGGTLAYFTSQDSRENVFTLGNVKGELTEESTAGTTPDGKPIKPGTPTDTGIDYDKVMPGDLLSKRPIITLDDNSAEAYTRVKLEVVNEDGKLTDAQKAELITEVCLDFGTGWTKVGEYVYYTPKLTATNKVAAPVFTMVSVPATWGNNAADAKFSIIVTADLIQADNFTPEMTGGNITGWNGTVVEAN